MAEFSKRYRCISFDHRGAGDSDKPKDAYSTQALARDASRCWISWDRESACGGHVDRRLRVAEPRHRLSGSPELLRVLQHLVKADEYITRCR